jgi:hypothetical protein
VSEADFEKLTNKQAYTLVSGQEVLIMLNTDAEFHSWIRTSASLQLLP